jgi:hypothetical protein
VAYLRYHPADGSALINRPRTLSADSFSTRPFLVDGRQLLPSLPSYRTLYVDTFRESDGKAAKGAADDHRRGRAESRTYQRRAYDGKVAKNVSVESVRWEGREERISGERTMGRQRRTYQWRAYDGKTVKNVLAESV